ncbi:SGNH/GDSL hydrolase family protein [Rhodococcus fascians]|uniref:SGNH/GDSL hydrolase family protein n=1 Tax=Rhodococcoides fascians TaxID=1828 RepID=UPI0024BB7298|nr:SGNH/GDSL hydrolase family protein [Rhodococcus fascians]MDJ0428017.1 SGNH/GDSL hydrolase family protein [Rhodococcus fascians]
MAKWYDRNNPLASRQFTRRNKIALSALLCVAVVVMVAAAYALPRQEAPEYTSNYSPPPPTTINYLRVTVLGDSYAAGMGASSSGAWTRVAARKSCWSVRLEAQADTGYVAAGTDRSTAFTDPRKLVDATANNPELILVQGSISDTGKSGVYEAAKAVYETLKARAPQASIVVIGPTNAPAIGATENYANRDAIQAAAAQTGLTFIDPIALKWLPDPALYAPDQVNLNGKGHRAYADDVLSALQDSRLTTRNGCLPA